MRDGFELGITPTPFWRCLRGDLHHFELGTTPTLLLGPRTSRADDVSKRFVFVARTAQLRGGLFFFSSLLFLAGEFLSHVQRISPSWPAAGGPRLGGGVDLTPFALPG